MSNNTSLVLITIIIALCILGIQIAECTPKTKTLMEQCAEFCTKQGYNNSFSVRNQKCICS